MSAEARQTVERADSGAMRARLPDGRWHFQHGPIDLIIGIDGDADAIESGIDRMWSRFVGVLGELAGELSLLRKPLTPAPRSARSTQADREPLGTGDGALQSAEGVRGRVARRMVRACLPHATRFITPMAAVAGAVADELVDLVRELPGVRRAYVNNGGDIALHLTHGASFDVGMVSGRAAAGAAHAGADDASGDLARIASLLRGRVHVLDGAVRIDFASAVRGVATSGWRGRSFSLGIADAVTVLAACAAQADAAATMISNAVNVDDPAIRRMPANRLKDDTDLGDRLVTTEVGRLTPAALNRALDGGEEHARALVDAGAAMAAALVLQGRVRLVAASDDIRSQLRLG